MTDHTVRLYALALALVVFFLARAVVAARPWATATAPDPRLKALAVRQAQLARAAKLVDTLGRTPVRTRASAPPPPAVRVVDLPPLTVTRTS